MSHKIEIAKRKEHGKKKIIVDGTEYHSITEMCRDLKINIYGDYIQKAKRHLGKDASEEDVISYAIDCSNEYKNHRLQVSDYKVTVEKLRETLDNTFKKQFKIEYDLWRRHLITKSEFAKDLDITCPILNKYIDKYAIDQAKEDSLNEFISNLDDEYLDETFFDDEYIDEIS